MSSDTEILLKKKRGLFSLLARTVIADSYEPVIGNRLRNEILSAMEDEQDKELRMASISSSMARREKIGQALDAAREKLSVLRSEETEARLRLGHMLFEARKDGVLDGRIDFMEEDHATYIRLQQQSRSPIKRVLTKIDLSGFEKNLVHYDHSHADSFLIGLLSSRRRSSSGSRTTNTPCSADTAISRSVSSR